MTTQNAIIADLAAEVESLRRINARLLNVAMRAEAFVAGLDDDDAQEGIPALLGDLRYAIAEAT